MLLWHEEDLERADTKVVDTAWWVGAWDVLRCWHLPLSANADPFSRHHGLVSLFDTEEAYAVRTSPMGLRDQDPDAKPLIAAAARDGWISWRFRPTLRSARFGSKVSMRDVTLAIDGTRTLPFLYPQVAPIPGEKETIQLGRERSVSGDKWSLSNQGTTLRDARQRLEMSTDGLATKLRLGSNGGRTVRRWEAGEVQVSGPAQVAIELLVGAKENAR